MASETQTQEPIGRIYSWAQRVDLERRLVILLLAGGVVAGVLTYLAVIGAAPFAEDRAAVRPLLLVDSIILLSLLGAVSARLVRLIVARRRGSAGSRMHVRLVTLFALVAIIPTIVVAVVSALFINVGVGVWFSESARSALNASVAVANAYVEENRKTIEADVRAIADAMRQNMPNVRNDPRVADATLQFFADSRGLPEAMIFESRGNIIARTRLSGEMERSGMPSEAMLDRARGGDVVLLRTGEQGVRALMLFDALNDSYMYVGRLVDPLVLGYAEETREKLANYRRLEDERSRIEFSLAAVFGLLALLLLSMAIWLGLIFANRLVQPISSLVGATERVRTGDLGVRVSEGPEDDEFGTLSRAFNRMTSQLRAQRGELIEANQQLDERRRFTEAVLAGVSAGVLSLDATGRITLPNRSATVLLDSSNEELVGRNFSDVMPEAGDLFETARAAAKGRQVDGEVRVTRGDLVRDLHVRIVGGTGEGGFVVTFDDVSELVSAQRRAAWADVARRIAHEIKNPLTPIKLSADRIRRKYADEIKTDPSVFEQCTQTIMRQVDDIGRMVDEFSKFARMPAPEFHPEDLRSIVEHVQFLQQSGSPDISYQMDLPPVGPTIYCDRGQVTQALTNLMQNAADAIEGRREAGEPVDGVVRVSLYEEGEAVRLVVEDNGKGLPKERDRLTEPYVTTRQKGTGLGLAIVKKIMEEHRGKLLLEDGTDNGARVTLEFPQHSNPRASAPIRAAAE